MPVQSLRPRRVDNSLIPNTIFGLLVANGLVFAAQLLGFIPAALALWPVGSQIGFFPTQLLTYGFLHGGFQHLLFNMFGLWMFGRDIERVMGPRRFLTYYLVCVAGAGLVQLAVAWMQGGFYPTVGASGGVFGILLAFGLFFPQRQVMLLFPPIPMPAWVLVTGFAFLELYYGVSGGSPGIANFAHLGGMLFGFLLILYWRRH